MNELARLQQNTDEVIAQGLSDYRINLSQLPGSLSILALDLREVAGTVANQTLSEIEHEWHPTHLDLVRESFRSLM